MMKHGIMGTRCDEESCGDRLRPCNAGLYSSACAVLKRDPMKSIRRCPKRSLLQQVHSLRIAPSIQSTAPSRSCSNIATAVPCWEAFQVAGTLMLAIIRILVL